MLTAKRITVAVAMASLLCVALPAAGRTGASAPRCLSGHLRLSFVRSEGATSHRFWYFALRNVGPGTCRLQGYPGVGLISRTGKLLPVHVARKPGPAPSVPLSVGRHAYFTFSYVVSGPCVPHFFSAYGLQVIPPERTRRLLYRSARIDVCSVSIGGHPTVSPIRATLGK